MNDNADNLRRPIDRQRESAGSIEIGTPDDASAITDVFAIGGILHIIKKQGIYQVRLADEIDPKRTNPRVPNVQQRVLALGSDNDIVARTLLTAHTLFKKSHLRPPFDEDRALVIAFDVLKDLASMEQSRVNLEEAEKTATTSCERHRRHDGSFGLPAVGNVNDRWDAFAQKAGHVLKSLRDLVTFFYGDKIKSRWIDSLARIAFEQHEGDSAFARFVNDARPLLLLVLDMRNMVEHPQPDKFIKVTDFSFLPTGEIARPSVEIVRPRESSVVVTTVDAMREVTNNLVHICELMMAFLCAHHVQPFAGFPIQVIELPPEQRANRKVRFCYGLTDGNRVMRFG